MAEVVQSEDRKNERAMKWSRRVAETVDLNFTGRKQTHTIVKIMFKLSVWRNDPITKAKTSVNEAMMAVGRVWRAKISMPSGIHKCTAS